MVGSLHLLNDPQRLQREFDRRLDTPESQNVDGARLRKSIGRLKLRVGRLIDAYENGWVEKAEFQPRIQRTKEQLAREQAALAQYEREAAGNEELRLVFGDFTAFAQQVSKGLEKADFPTRRKLLRLLVNRIQVDQDEVRIVYKVQPRPFALGLGSGAFLQNCLNSLGKPQGRSLVASGASPPAPPPATQILAGRNTAALEDGSRGLSRRHRGHGAPPEQRSESRSLPPGSVSPTLG